MKYSDQIKSISYLKANTAEILRRLAERGEPLVITQNGVAKAVVQDIARPDRGWTPRFLDTVSVAIAQLVTGASERHHFAGERDVELASSCSLWRSSDSRLQTYDGLV
jgi:prevent-host-death family protein